MKVEINGKSIIIADKEIENLKKSLDISTEEAVELWLDDHDYTENEEQAELDEKAKKVKVDHGAESKSKRKTPSKPKTVKVSDEKTNLWADIIGFLGEKYEINVVTSNKLVEINLNGKNFKLNLSETRAKKA